MRKKIIAANWKMHGSLESLTMLASHIADIDTAAQLIVFPPFVFLPAIQKILDYTSVAWGAQNVANTESGAYTGEISADMLREFGCRYVLIGHSERRQLFAETDDILVQKIRLALKAQLCPILCVGESRTQREEGNTFNVVLAQIQAVIEGVGIAAFEQMMIAYEPIWAIGTGLTATPEQAQAVHAKIREHLATIDDRIGQEVCLLYGGSVKPDNAQSLFQMPDIDGGLVGGASLDAASFAKIVQST